MSSIVHALALLLSRLPLSILYLFSDFLYFALYILAGYRIKVVRENLRYAFPNKNKAELEKTERQFYFHLCDVIVETIKLFSISKEELARRCVLTQDSIRVLEKYKSEKRSLVLVSGHCGNWEWVGSAFSIQAPYPLTVSYRPATNRSFDEVLLSMRTRFGTNVIPVQEVIRNVLNDRNKITAMGFISDQTPPKEYARWIPFMHRETPVYTGAGKVAVKFNYPMLFIHIRALKRGYYEISTELIEENLAASNEETLTRAHTGLLEKDIELQPWNWLWSHKRWKHKNDSELKSET